MLGYTHTGSSNVFIFFDGDDILNLREEKGALEFFSKSPNAPSPLTSM